MVDHKVWTGYPTQLAEINGHSPRSSYNENTEHHSLFCDTCGWVGRSYKGRWAEKADEQWAVHAADIAMRRKPTDGQKHTNCHCWYCLSARRVAAEEARRTAASEVIGS